MAKKSSKKQKEAFQMPIGKLDVLSLLSIIPSKTNPRKDFNEESLKELSESIKTLGLMQPIVVHCDADNEGYELICGERRYRAAQLAGLEKIPAMVYPTLPDDLILELQITENLQRADINPMEESDAFFELTKRGMTTADDIAKRLSKSVRYVYDRLALQGCIEEVQKDIREHKINIKTGKRFARLVPSDQKVLYQKFLSGSDISELEDSLTRNLMNAPFDIESTDLLDKAGSCLTCSKRSGCNQLLFDDIQSHDICFDTSCFNQKLNAHIEAVISKLESEGLKVFKISALYGNAAHPFLGFQNYDVLSEGDPGYETCKIRGVVMERNPYNSELKIGDVLRISIDEDYAEEAGIIEEIKPFMHTVEEAVDSDESQENNSSDHAFSNNGNGLKSILGDQKAPQNNNSFHHFKHQEAFIELLLRNAVQSYGQNSLVFVPKLDYVSKIRSLLDSMDTDVMNTWHKIISCEPTLHIEDFDAFFKRFMDYFCPDGVTGIESLYYFVDWVDDHCGSHFDPFDFDDHSDLGEYKRVGIDLPELMLQYFQQNDLPVQDVYDMINRMKQEAEIE
jgi:ParB/RepB/Spo0J family partition protein